MTIDRKPLENSYARDPAEIRSRDERIRVVRNIRHVARLTGKRGPVVKTMVKKYGLSIDDALSIIGRDRAWRRIDDKRK